MIREIMKRTYHDSCQKTLSCVTNNSHNVDRRKYSRQNPSTKIIWKWNALMYPTAEQLRGRVKLTGNSSDLEFRRAKTSRSTILTFWVTHAHFGDKLLGIQGKYLYRLILHFRLAFFPLSFDVYGLLTCAWGALRIQYDDMTFRRLLFCCCVIMHCTMLSVSRLRDQSAITGDLSK